MLQWLRRRGEANRLAQARPFEGADRASSDRHRRPFREVLGGHMTTLTFELLEKRAKGIALRRSSQQLIDANADPEESEASPVDVYSVAPWA